MGTIRSRTTNSGEPRYQAIVKLKGSRFERATFRRKTDAKRWIQDTESAIRDRRYFKTTEAAKHTTKQLLDRYEELELPKLKSGPDRVTHLNYWRESLGQLSVANLSSSDIAEERDRLTRGSTHQSRRRSPATVNRYLATLSHALSIARYEWKWMTHSPFDGVRKLREPSHRIRFLSDSERQALLGACRKSRATYLYPIVLLALSTGMRRGELLGLRWSNVDLKRGAATLKNTKNNDARFVPLAGLALKELEKLSKIRRIDSDLLFPGQDGAIPVDFKEAWNTAVKEAGITDFKFHDLRHTAASYLAMNGASASEIAAVLGHKTLAMVKRYAHIADEHTASVVAAMNKKFLAHG